MERTRISEILTVLFAVVLCFGPVGLAEPLGTAFMYQGRLIDNNQPADGLYDLQFKLFNAVADGNQIGTDTNMPDVDAIDGYFTVELDFGSVFDGNALWLDIGVRPGDLEDPNVYTVLSPRQKITPAPYALYAAGGVAADSDWIIAGNNMYSGVSGNVGIGTASPGAKLDINGDINAASDYKIGGNTVLSVLGTYNTLLGLGAGQNNTGNYNTFSGYQAGRYNTTGYFNNFSGYKAGYSNTTGYFNTFSGAGAGVFNTTGSYNTFSGYQTGYSNTTGSGNVFLGYKAGYYETASNKLYIANSDVNPPLIYGDFSTGNIGLGTTSPSVRLEVAGQVKITGGSPSAGKVLTSDLNGLATWQTTAGDNLGNHIATQNIQLGSNYLSGDGGSEGVYVSNNGNVGVGKSSPTAKLDVGGDISTSSVYKITGYTVLSIAGTGNTLVGLGAGLNNAGSYNTFAGDGAGYLNTTGNYNTCLGRAAGYSNTTGIENTFIGFNAGFSNNTGNYNTFTGKRAGYLNNSGSDNTFSGFHAGYWNNGSRNTYLGREAGATCGDVNDNTFVGYMAGYSSSSGSNSFFGSGAGQNSTTGNYNTFSGYEAGHNTTTGNYNTFSGASAGFYNTTGYRNIFSGYAAGYKNTIGNENTFSGFSAGQSNTEGSSNTFLGYEAGLLNTTGSSNTFSGRNAGYNNNTGGANTFLGYEAGYSNATGSGNVFLGYRAGYYETGSNKLYIGNDNTDPLIYGDFATDRVGINTTNPGTYALYVNGTAYATGGWYPSDLRFKQNIETIDSPIDKVMNIKGVSFEWKRSEYKDKGFPEGRHYGVIAQEIEQVLPELVKEGPDGEKAVSYTELVPVLTEAIKEQQKQIESLRSEVKALQEAMRHNQFTNTKEVQQ